MDTVEQRQQDQDDVEMSGIQFASQDEPDYLDQASSDELAELNMRLMLANEQKTLLLDQLGLGGLETFSHNDPIYRATIFIYVDPRRHDLFSYTANKVPWQQTYRNNQRTCQKNMDTSAVKYWTTPENLAYPRPTLRRRHSIQYGEQSDSAPDFYRPGDAFQRFGMRYPVHKHELMQLQERKSVNHHWYNAASIEEALGRLAAYSPSEKSQARKQGCHPNCVRPCTNAFHNTHTKKKDISLLFGHREAVAADNLSEEKQHFALVASRLLKHEVKGWKHGVGAVLSIDDFFELENFTIPNMEERWGLNGLVGGRDGFEVHVDWPAKEIRSMKWQSGKMAQVEKRPDKQSARFVSTLTEEDVRALSQHLSKEKTLRKVLEVYTNGLPMERFSKK